MIYFDNAATTIYKPKSVIDAVVSAINNSGNAGRGINSASLYASNNIYDCRNKLSNFFNLNKPNNIVFTNNSTEALNTVIKGILKSGDHVITSVLEHNSVLRPLYEMSEIGVDISYIDCDDYGNLYYDDIVKNIRDNTKMIVLTHSSNVIGNIVDIERVGKIAKDYDLLFVVDASQTAGVFDIDVKKMNIDVLCFTGHKSLLAMQGVGGMAINTDVYIKPLKSGGTGIKTFEKHQPLDLPTHLEAGTLNSHGIAGLSMAIDYINEIGLNCIREKEQELMKMFYIGVLKIDGIKIYGDFTNFNRAPIVSINVLDYDSGRISDYLYEEYGIVTRPKGHCAPLIHKRFNTVEQGMVRFSFCYKNTEKEIDKAIKALKNI